LKRTLSSKAQIEALIYFIISFLKTRQNSDCKTYRVCIFISLESKVRRGARSGTFDRLL